MVSDWRADVRKRFDGKYRHELSYLGGQQSYLLGKCFPICKSDRQNGDVRSWRNECGKQLYWHSDTACIAAITFTDLAFWPVSGHCPRRGPSSV